MPKVDWHRYPDLGVPAGAEPRSVLRSSEGEWTIRDRRPETGDWELLRGGEVVRRAPTRSILKEIAER